MLRTFATSLFAGVVASLSLTAAAQTSIDHSQIAYFVPDKRVRLEARVTDPKGVKVARAYFKAGAQADYTYVPMTASSGGRYVATLPAPSAATPSIEYLFLAQNNDGAVARTEAYTVAARRGGETPAWQSASNAGDMKVYTELPNAPKTVAGFTDSITLDLAESGARLGAAAGVYGGGGGAAGGGTAATSGTAAGGLSTMAIVGGVAAAVGVAAAAGGGGGGGGGGAPGGGNLAGTWTGSENATMNFNCAGQPASCTVNIPFTGTVNSSNTFNGTVGNATVNCSSPGLAPIAQSVAVGGPITFQLNTNGVATLPAVNVSQQGVTVSCPAGTVTFNGSPRSISGSQSCTATATGCTINWSFSFSGS